MGWPDILIGVILLIAGLKGFKRGFIMELAGAIALMLSLIVPWFYNGAFDGAIASVTHAGPGASHIIALFCVGAGTYLAVMILARVLSTMAKLPIIGMGNALAGAAVGLAKGAILIWLVLYVALFFPLTPDVRRDFHTSPLAGVFTRPDSAIDDRISSTLPLFAQPFVRPVFDRHRV